MTNLKFKLKEKHIKALEELDPSYSEEFEEIIDNTREYIIPHERKVRRLRSESNIESYDFGDYPDGKLKDDLKVEVVTGGLFVGRLDDAYVHLEEVYIKKYGDEVPPNGLIKTKSYRCYSAMKIISDFLDNLEILKYGNANIEIMNKGMKCIGEEICPVMAYFKEHRN